MATDTSVLNFLFLWRCRRVISPRRHEEHEGKMEFDSLSNIVIGAGLMVHKALGPGLLESSYEACTAYQLRTRGHKVEQQKVLPLEYKGVRLDCGYRLDLVVDDQIIIEIKAAEKLLPIHEAQMLTYLRVSGLRVGLLMNFNVVMFRDGLKRIVY